MPRQTDKDLVGITIIDKNESGYVTNCESAGNFDTTASKFAVGCRLVDTTTGKPYYNAGSVAVPSWNSVSEVNNAEMDSGVQKVISVPLTAAQINGMYAAPVEIVPAVAGKSIIVDSVDFDITRTATQFAGGGTAAVQYDSTVHGAGTATTAVIAAAVITAGAGRTITARIPVVLSDVASASIVGKGLYLSNVDAAFTTGTGTAVITVRYHLV